MEKISKRERTDAWILALFLAESNVCSCIASFVLLPNMSVIFLGGLCLVLLVSHKGRISVDKKCCISFFAVTCLLIISTVKNGLSNTQEYIFYFVVFGGIALLLISNRVQYELVFLNILKLYIVIIAIYFIRQRKSFLSSQDYWSNQMGVAYGMVIPILFAFAFILFKKKLFFEYSKWYILAALLIIITGLYIILFDCGTRGAIVTCVLGCGLVFIASTEKEKTMLLFISVVLLGIFILLQMDNILGWAELAFSDSKILALRKLSQMISMDKVDNGRKILFDNAIEYFRSKPIFGNGIGYFEKRNNGIYVHEFFLELLCEYGAVGTFIFSVIVICFWLKVFTSRLHIEKIFATILIGISSTLLYSSSYWLLPSFWFSIFFVIKYRKKENINND